MHLGMELVTNVCHQRTAYSGSDRHSKRATRFRRLVPELTALHVCGTVPNKCKFLDTRSSPWITPCLQRIEILNTSFRSVGHALKGYGGERQLLSIERSTDYNCKYTEVLLVGMLLESADEIFNKVDASEYFSN